MLSSEALLAPLGRAELSATVTPTSESPQVSLGALAISGVLTNSDRICYDASIVKYFALLPLLALGIVELALRIVGLACLTVLTLWIGVFCYVDDNPSDFKDLMTPVCFKLAERLVA